VPHIVAADVRHQVHTGFNSMGKSLVIPMGIKPPFPCQRKSDPASTGEEKTGFNKDWFNRLEQAFSPTVTN
jgi:hypothetical protein